MQDATPDVSFFPLGTLSSEVRAATEAFWTAEAALPEATARERSSQVIAHAMQDGEIVGVATGFVGVSKLLQQPMFNYRTYISAKTRRQGIAGLLLQACFSRLEQHFSSMEDPPAIGVLLEIPTGVASVLNQKLHWPETQFDFLGKTGNGSHLRVRYFKKVKLKPVHG